MMLAGRHHERDDSTKFADRLAEATRDLVRRQVETGIDVVSDGELSKASYATYVSERLAGFGGNFRGHAAQDLRDYPDLAQQLVAKGSVIPTAGGSCCQGPVKVKNLASLHRDIRNFRTAVDSASPQGAFMNAASPGVIAVFQKNEYYPDEDAYIESVAAAMQTEYEAIVAAGFLLQVDCPDLAMGRHLACADISDAEFLRVVHRNVAALNHALRNIPAELIRLHICWGNYPGPHHRDIPLDKIIQPVLTAQVKYLLIEGANPRHAHEWKVFSRRNLPDDKVLIPGVIDSTSNYIEHPEVVAQRIDNYVQIVGPERVMAGADCGFATFSEYPSVHPDIVWAKLESLVAGAQLASKALA